MERAGEILGTALRRLGKPETAMAWLEAVWPALVGEKLAAHTRPMRLAGGTLEISADTAEWQNELESMAGEFLSKINGAWGGPLLRELQFKRVRKAVPREEDNDHTPFVRASRRGARPQSRE